MYCLMLCVIIFPKPHISYVTFSVPRNFHKPNIFNLNTKNTYINRKMNNNNNYYYNNIIKNDMKPNIMCKPFRRCFCKFGKN